jgi:hypothetical protein
MASSAAAENAADTTTVMFIYAGFDAIPPTVTHLIVDSCVKDIPPAACLHCVRLTQVQLPDGLETIGSRAFSCCQALKSIVFPATVREIGDRAFQNCCALKEVVLPQGLLKLGEESFDGCISLLSVDFPSSLRVIGKLAFHRTRLTEFNVPDSVEDCGSFKDCHIPNLRMPSITATFDTSIFELRAENNIISIELPENIKQVFHPDSFHSRLPGLRNIAYPMGCSVHIADDMEDEDLVNMLQHRFDGLPLHKICYYHSYHDTAQVILDMKRTIFPGSTRSRYGKKLSDIGNRQDSMRMTPLHIVTCSTTHHLEMYQLLVEHYPENLIAEDRWEQIPLVYAFWCGAPSEIIAFLAESYKAKHPEYVFDWEGTVEHFISFDAPLPRIQVLLDTHGRIFPDQELNMMRLVIRLAGGLDNNADVRATVPIAKFQFLLRASIAKRLESLNVREWSDMFDRRIAIIHFLPGKLKDRAWEFYAMLTGLEYQKETTCLLELALWQTALADQKATINDDTYRTQCRVNCGAEVVIQNVLPFLWPTFNRTSHLNLDSDVDSDY